MLLRVWRRDECALVQRPSKPLGAVPKARTDLLALVQGLAVLMALLLVASCSKSETVYADAGADRDAGAKARDAGKSDDKPSTQNPDAGGDRLQLAFETATNEGFSGAALVRYRGEVLLLAASGEASRADDVPNTTDTPFDVGSLTKQFTGAAVLALAERDKLSLDDTIADFFEQVPADKADITVHQLLTHTAGLPDAVGDDDEAVALEEYLTRVFERDLFYAPGTVHYYSNAGYSLLAAIIEQASGQSYESFLREALFEPAGMTQTGYLLPEWEVLPATGYAEDRLDEPLLRPHDETGYTWNLRGNGGVLSTTEDLLRWHDALAAEHVLGAHSLELLQAAHVDEGIGHTFYGYGWVSEETSAGKLVWHDGGNGFFFAQVLRYLDEDLQIITLANEASLAAEDLARTLALTLLPELEQDQLEWELLFEGDLLFEEHTETFVEEAEVDVNEEHIAGFGAYIESGHADFRVTDPDGNLFFEERVVSGEYRERTFAIDERDGTWSFEVELTDATGDFFFGWGRRAE